MSVTLEDVQPYIDKDATIHLRKEDGTLEEVTVLIKAATIAGVAYKPKGKSGIELTTVEQIEEIQKAPVKERSILQRKRDLVDEGKMRQHLADHHGIALSWCKNASEADAVTFHDTIDHADLGHVHVDKAAEAKAAEEKAAQENASAASESAVVDPAPGDN